ncbi:hypothetical protein [Ochrobactrum sp. RH2CCR150]|uniref:hypothetical protein n=1 Tax=Ochrobactrum sp. RH2CCR150 TaxID=2587044 RepID=UPI0015FAF42B|nr:hypothetical protein [Ochrobactrum sp. RH2CCR150]
MTRIIYLFLLLIFVVSAGLYFIDAHAADAAPSKTNAHHCDSYEKLADYIRCLPTTPNTDGK